MTNDELERLKQEAERLELEARRLRKRIAAETSRQLAANAAGQTSQHVSISPAGALEMRQATDSVFTLDNRRFDVDALVASLKWEIDGCTYSKGIDGKMHPDAHWGSYHGLYRGYEFTVGNVAESNREARTKAPAKWIGYCAALEERTRPHKTRKGAVEAIARSIDEKLAGQAAQLSYELAPCAT